MMFLKYRYRLALESLCAEVADPISWTRFCRIGLGAKVPHPSTVEKITTGAAATRSGNWTWRCWSGPPRVAVAMLRSAR
jgi:IS5 family transposase